MPRTPANAGAKGYGKKGVGCILLPDDSEDAGKRLITFLSNDQLNILITVVSIGVTLPVAALLGREKVHGSISLPETEAFACIMPRGRSVDIDTLVDFRLVGIQIKDY